MLHRILTGILLLSLATGAVAKQDDNKVEQDKQSHKQEQNDRKQAQDDHKQNGWQDKQNDKLHQKDKPGHKVALNVGPTVSLTAPTNNAAFAEPANITLSANASISGLADLLLNVSKVEFYRNGVLIGTDTTAPYSVVWSNAAAGNYAITAKAYDTLNFSTTSSAVNIAVIAPPVVDISAPANNTVLAAQSAITINANASSNRGQSIAKVEFYQGSTLVGTSTSAPYTLTLPNMAPATYTFTAKATDTVGGVTTSTPVSVRIALPPNVSLTSPANSTIGIAPATFNLNANTNADSGLSIAKVDFYQDTTLIGTATTAPYSFTWSNVASGSYTLTAIATDNLGGTTTSAPINVISNIAPTASMTAPINNTALAAPATFSLSADASDSDGTIAKVDFYDGSSLIGTATTAPYSYTWNNVADGLHSVTAVATDDRGTTGTSAAISLIAVTPPSVNITAPANGTVMTAPASFNLSANATASTTGGAITKVEFYQDNQLLGTVTNAPYTYTWSNVAAGNYSITAKAYDSYGITTTSAAVTLTANTAPTIELTSPGEGAQYIAPATITLNANAVDSDGTIAQVDFYQGNTLLASVTTSPYTYNWSGAQPGNYSLTATATDNLGATTTTSAVNIVIHQNQAPTVSLTAPTANDNFTDPANIQLVANATDSDGTIAQVQFYDGTTLLGTATSSPYVFDWNNVAIGSYTLTAIATDNLGLSTTSAPVQITVSSGVAQVYYIHTDQLDTPRLITDSNNNPVWRWDNTDPFGNNPVNDDPNATGKHFTFNQRFPGQYYDVETNTHYNYFRDYDPSTGRYIESDPIGLAGGINTYGYVGGNPMRGIDPYGLALICKIMIDYDWVAKGRGWKTVGYKLAGGNNPLSDAILDSLSNTRTPGPGFYFPKIIPIKHDLQLMQRYEFEIDVCTDECTGKTTKTKVGERPLNEYREDRYNPTVEQEGDPEWQLYPMRSNRETRWGL